MFTQKIKRYLSTIGYILIILSVLILIGWSFNITLFKSITSELTAMNPLTAVSFIISGYWLITFTHSNWNTNYATLSSGLAVFLIGLSHSLAYLLQLDWLRFDHFLFKSKIESSSINAHMAPVTALLFALSGITILTSNSTRKCILKIRSILSLIVFILAYSSLLGYIYGRDSAYRVEGISTIALSTAILFLLLGIGFFLSNVQTGLPKLFASILEGSALFRRVTVFMLVFPPLLGYLRILGEKEGYFDQEYGFELFTIVFTVIIFILVYYYANLLNNKQKAGIALEKKLIKSERQFHEMITSLKEGVASINFEGKVLFCNPSFCKLLGYSEQELIGQLIVELIIPLEKREEFYNRLNKRKAGELNEDYQTEVIRRDGEKIIIDTKSNTLFDENGNKIAIIMSINDVTNDIRQLEDIKAFSSSAAHDLNNPINKIITVVDLVDPTSLNEENRELLQMVKSTVLNMKVLTQDLLTFSRLGKQPLEKADVHLQGLVAEVIKQQQPLDFKGTIKLNNLPNAYGNEAALKQLYNNLISNAFKYSSRKEKPEIEIGSYQKEHQTFYYVKDNGVGLNQEQMKTLFTPFKRYHSKFEGNGLGLAIVKRIVDKHGGTIFIESDTDKGLTFHFTLSHN